MSIGSIAFAIEYLQGFADGKINPSYASQVRDARQIVAVLKEALVLLQDRENAYGYACRLFKQCAPQCECLPTLSGVLTQLDHLLATQPPASPRGERERPILAYLTAAEVQSKSDRLKWAEGLILQLPTGHNGRDSWLLNFGEGEEAQEMRKARHKTFHPESRAINRPADFVSDTSLSIRDQQGADR